MKIHQPKRARFTHDFPQISGGDISRVAEMKYGEGDLFGRGLDCLRVIRIDITPLFIARPAIIDYQWQEFYMETTATAFNGQRWWFVCPACHNRNAGLYWRDNRLECRKCHGIRYASQYETFETPFDRLCHRIKKERVAIWGPDEPDVGFLLRSPTSFKRPKGMRRKTFLRKLERLQDLQYGWAIAALKHLNS
ncbi:hypothetical protein [Lelliottia amnigena]|jgi:Zn ribbon nucleic-acid-binding protein|uniref:hypothetical protein n=1 Tax=Lelliottia amnigena TaxID=61646 RepID=UPI00192AFD58|nr:hypothetical protein [Lelliottia amnigena]MBL5930780.1 hypothetical protein [Lelliottia amnigena]MCE9967211.1 hypothetical protein [Lelliottia amnigena]QXZ20487.1 hypothetical protein I6L75_04865 [Lelliottia amnigena]